MVGLVILAYVAMAAFELYLWAERPWKKVVVYLAFFAAAGTLAALLTLNKYLKVPEPLGALQRWIAKLWQGGGSK